MISISSIVYRLRGFRVIHRYIGVLLAIFFITTAFTGILLGWKKDVEILQPATQKGQSTDVAHWKSFAEITSNAKLALESSGIQNAEIDRLDARLDKGIIKVLFKNAYWEAQVDATTGKVLSIAQRHADWIEHIHDGSIFSDFFKVTYTNILGIGLLTLSLTGLYMWYAPKIVRRSKHRK